MKFLLMFLILVISCGDDHSKKTYKFESRSTYVKTRRTETEQTQFDEKLADIKTTFQRSNIRIDDTRPYLSTTLKCPIVIDATGTMSEYARAFYEDVMVFSRASNFQIQGMKFALDLTARANDMKKDVNAIRAGQTIDFYTMGNFNFYIPNIEPNLTNLFSRIMTEQIIYVKGEIVAD